MEKEIDNIFTNSQFYTSDDVKVENLRKSVTKIKTLYPYLNNIEENVEEVLTKYKIFQVQLSALSDDLTGIDKQNSNLESKLSVDNDLFEKLRDLTMALNINQSYIQILENGHFDDSDHLAKMDKALNILSGFNQDKFTIRLVKEAISKVTNIQRRFFKRFEIFLNKLLLSTKASGELKVHKEIYSSIREYSFIFIAALKCKENYFSGIYNSYINFTCKIYDGEFRAHLSSISGMINDPHKLSLAIEVLVKSFESLTKVEFNFLRNLTGGNVRTGPELSHALESGLETIFKQIGDLILEFINRMYKKSKLITILAISHYIGEEQTEVVGTAGRIPKVYISFIEELRRKDYDLQSLFVREEIPYLVKLTVDNEPDRKIRKTRIVKLNYLFLQDKIYNLQKQTIMAIVKKIKSQAKVDNLGNDMNKLKKLIELIQIIYTFKLKEELVSSIVDIISFLKTEISKKATQVVFSADTVEDGIKQVIAVIGKDLLSGQSEVLRIIRIAIIEASESSEKESVVKVFESINLNLPSSPSN